MIEVTMTYNKVLEAGVATIAFSSELKNNGNEKKNKLDENFKSSYGESHP